MKKGCGMCNITITAEEKEVCTMASSVEEVVLSQ